MDLSMSRDTRDPMRVNVGFAANMFYVPARTAQGGGGSFKDRKPIGEVDCCDAWMAEQSH